MYAKCVLRRRWGFVKLRPGCASRRREGGRAASEVDHHARPLAARWRGRNERGERGRNEPMGHFRRDFSKGLLEGTFRRDFSKGLPEGTSLRDFLKVLQLLGTDGMTTLFMGTAAGHPSLVVPMRRFTAQVHTMPLEGCVRALFFFLREREIHTTDETYALKVKITQGTRSHYT